MCCLCAAKQTSVMSERRESASIFFHRRIMCRSSARGGRERLLQKTFSCHPHKDREAAGERLRKRPMITGEIWGHDTSPGIAAIGMLSLHLPARYVRLFVQRPQVAK